MPKELPGFYYDPEKNRYFPIKGPIPGSTTLTPKKPLLNSLQASKTFKRVGINSTKLLHGRELYGTVATFGKQKCNFQVEYQKKQASQPVVWKYRGTDKVASAGSLEQVYVDLLTPEGQRGTDVLLAGGVNEYFSLFEVVKNGEHLDSGATYKSDCVWSLIVENQTEVSKAPGHIWIHPETPLLMPSIISCIKLSRKQPSITDFDGYSTQHALIATLGARLSGGSVYILDLSEPFDSFQNVSIMRRMKEVASFNCTIWTADCNITRGQAAIGTNLGAALVDLETGVSSWVCRSKSDVLSQQLDQSGNVVLCGLRNGAIVTVDARQKQDVSRLTRHRIPYAGYTIHESFRKAALNSRKQWFELKGNIYPSQTIWMPSSISCMVSLQHYEQYLLASSMDGLIMLYDHRQFQRGAIQSYEGNVNTHSCLQLGVDPSERFVMSGGEDCKFRIWSIKSGELVFENKFSDSVISTVCWPRTGSEDLSSGAWLGSREGLFRIICS